MVWLTACSVLAAQDASSISTPDSDPAIETDFDGMFRGALLRDVETADEQELLDWAGSLGIDTGGSRTDLESRIIEAYGFRRIDLEAERVEVLRGPQTSENTARAQGRPPAVLRIESASNSEFFELEQQEEQYLRLSGGVELSIDQEGTLHRIVAQEIVINLSRGVLTAREDVRYETVRDGEREDFRGEVVVFSIDTWEGEFLFGTTETVSTSEADRTVFSVTGRRITRSENEIVVVDGGRITSSQAKPPNYEIRAQRMWILAPGEWGLRRVTLNVGRIPMFYLPVFFLPGDRLFFRPSVGVEERRGTYIQTTTYLLGSSDDDEPPISILRLVEEADDRDREIEGLFLRIPDQPGEPRRDDWSLKFMVDLYTGLGGFGGVSASLPDLGVLQTLEGELAIAASRALYERNGVISPWYVDEASGDASEAWDSGWFLGTEYPFRFRGSGSIDGRSGPLGFSASVLSLSDPSFDRDFLNRRESMDWSFALGPDLAGPEASAQIGDVSSQAWTTTFDFTPTIPAGFRPWLEQASVERVQTAMQFRTRTAGSLPTYASRFGISESPTARFLYPENLVMPDARLQVSGVLWRYQAEPDVVAEVGDESGLPADGTNNDREQSFSNDPYFRPPWDEDDLIPTSPRGDFRLPELVDDLPGFNRRTAPQASLTYRIEPGLRVDRFTDNGGWDQPSDVELAWRYQSLQSQSRVASDFTARDALGRFRLGSGLSADIRYQDVQPEPVLSAEEEEQLRVAAAAFRGVNIDTRTDLSFQPFPLRVPISGSQLSYRFGARILERSNEETGSATYVAQDRWISWDTSSISEHAGSATFDRRNRRGYQRLVATADLPPLLGRYRGTVEQGIGPVVNSVSGGFSQDAEGSWTPQTLVQRHVLAFLSDNVRLEQSLEYDLERMLLLRSRSDLYLWFVRAGLTGRESPGLRFDQTAGWVTDTGDPSFRWTNVELVADASRTIGAWRRRITVGLAGSMTLDWDLVRYTSAALRLAYGFDLSVYRFLDLEVRARSSNNRLYQYVPALAGEIGVPARSLGEDLADSIAFARRDRRERSLFKLDSIDIAAVHDLDDWEISLAYSGRPELETTSNPQRYVWESLLSLVIRWRAIPELERGIDIEDGSIVFEPGDS